MPNHQKIRVFGISRSLRDWRLVLNLDFMTPLLTAWVQPGSPPLLRDTFRSAGVHHPGNTHTYTVSRINTSQTQNSYHPWHCYILTFLLLILSDDKVLSLCAAWRKRKKKWVFSLSVTFHVNETIIHLLSLIHQKNSNHPCGRETWLK